MNIEDCGAMVTGGASGLGLATAKRLVDKGARVTVVDLPGSEGDAGVRSAGSQVSFVPADITDEEQVRAAVETAAAHVPLRAVVHCAGRGGDRSRIVDRNNMPGELASFVDVVTTNLVGTYNVLRLAGARMSRNEPDEDGRGACVLTASVAAFDGQVGQASYSASKAGVHGMTLVAARDLASHQIRVNTIAPGTFDTPMLARLRADLRAKLEGAVPHPTRLGEPQDFAHLAVALLENPYVNGETIRLDGAIRMAPR